MTHRLLEMIRDAFPLETIHSDGAWGPHGTSYPDADAYAARIDGRTWAQLDAKYIVTRDDALGFLAPAQLAAVLPVYLGSIAEQATMSPAFEAVMITLTRPASATRVLRFDALVTMLTPAQRHAIAVVLRDLADGDNGSPGERAGVALAKRWQEYL